MDRYRIRECVAQLVDHSPEQAVEILTRCCEERERTLQEVFSSLIQSRPKQNESPVPVGNNINVTFPPRVPPSSHGSQHTGTPPPRQGPPRRFPSTSYPISPPATASSVTSHSTRDENSSGEYILLPTLVGTKVVDHKVRMRPASIKHSVIRGDVVGRRQLEDSFNISQAGLTHVEVPHRVTGEIRLVPVSCAIELTWRQPHSNSTHETLFYVVPKEDLDIDILLGCYDSGQEIAEYTPTIVPQSTARHPSTFQNYKQDFRPHAPTPPPASSFHRSAVTYDGASSIHRQDDRYNPHHVLEPLISRQQSYARNMEGQQSSPAPTVLDTHIEHPHPLRPNVGPSAPVRDADPKKATDRIRLSVVWDATTLNVWLDLNEYGEDFYQAFQQQAAKQRKDVLDRTTMRIQLKKDKNLPYEEAYSLSLDEDELEADWETTCEWLNANKRDKMPHIYGVVETDGG